MFSRKTKETQKSNKNFEINIIAANTTFVGDIKSDGDFRIDGTLEGTLKTKGKLIISKSGSIKGEAEAQNADIGGAFIGKLKITETLNLKETANISGDTIVGNLFSEPGAIFNATCSMKGFSKDSNKKNAKKR